MKILSNHTITVPIPIPADNIVFLMADDSTSERTEMKKWNKIKKQLTSKHPNIQAHTPELRGSAHLRNEKCMQVSIAGRRMVSTVQQHSKKRKNTEIVKNQGERRENRTQADALQIHTKWHPQPQKIRIHPQAKSGDRGEMVNHLGINLDRVFVWHCPWGLLSSHPENHPVTLTQAHIGPLTSLSVGNFTLVRKGLGAGWNLFQGGEKFY